MCEWFGQTSIFATISFLFETECTFFRLLLTDYLLIAVCGSVFFIHSLDNTSALCCRGWFSGKSTAAVYNKNWTILHPPTHRDMWVLTIKKIVLSWEKGSQSFMLIRDQRGLGWVGLVSSDPSLGKHCSIALKCWNQWARLDEYNNSHLPG